MAQLADVTRRLTQPVACRDVLFFTLWGSSWNGISYSACTQQVNVEVFSSMWRKPSGSPSRWSLRHIMALIVQQNNMWHPIPLETCQKHYNYQLKQDRCSLWICKCIFVIWQWLFISISQRDNCGEGPAGANLGWGVFLKETMVIRACLTGILVPTLNPLHRHCVGLYVQRKG